MTDAPPLRSAARIGYDVELRAIRNESRRFPAHWHADLQVIGTIEGRGTAWVDGKRTELPNGAVIVIPPGAVHTACELKAGAGWTFLSLHIEPHLLRGTGVRCRWAPVTDIRGGPIATAFWELTATVLERRSADPGQAWASLLEAIGTNASTMQAQPVPAGLLLGREWLETNLGDRTTVDAIAAKAGYGRRVFEREFKHVFHLSPHAWRLVARVEAAKRALRAGLTVAEAAQHAGYGNLAHFSRQYRQLTGITARAYSARFRVPTPTTA